MKRILFILASLFGVVGHLLAGTETGPMSASGRSTVSVIIPAITAIDVSPSTTVGHHSASISTFHNGDDLILVRAMLSSHVRRSPIVPVSFRPDSRQDGSTVVIPSASRGWQRVEDDAPLPPIRRASTASRDESAEVAYEVWQF